VSAARTTDATPRAVLEDERDLLVASLADADREHDAGDLADDDYRLLRARDEERLGDIERRLADIIDTPDPAAAHINGTAPGMKSGRARRPVVLVLAGVALVVIGAVVLVVHLTTHRLPGQTATGSVQLSQAQQINQELAQADTLLASNDTADAINIYSQVLSQDPHDPAALAQLGWLTYEQGALGSDQKTVGDGRALVQQAIAADPKFGPAHLYDGVILLNSAHDPAGAVAQFRLFLAEHPSEQNLKNGAPFIRQAFADEHLPPPAAVAH
jgi:hypothetical protein